MTTEYKKILPRPTMDSDGFWESVKRHQMALQKCLDCGAFHFPPSDMCPECWSFNTQWTPVSGKGKVFSFVVFHQRYHPAWEGDVPYDVTLVELEEGPRMLTNVVGVKPDEIKVGLPVEVAYDDVTPEATLPKFRPLS